MKSMALNGSSCLEIAHGIACKPFENAGFCDHHKPNAKWIALAQQDEQKHAVCQSQSLSLHKCLRTVGECLTM